MPDWSGGLAHAIAAAGIVTAALSGVAAPDDNARAQAGPDRFGTAGAPATATATATATARSEVLGTGPTSFSGTAAQDTQGPNYFPS